MEFPKELRYTETDEWVRVKGNIATVGLSDFAQDQLSDLVYFESLVEIGDTVEAEGNLATVESVKSAGDVLSPVSGEIIEINGDLEDEPEIINTDPYGNGWMFKIEMSDPTEVEGLLTAEEYQDQSEG
ncbi:MAG TPA: glycine cleavage system protein GcvH [Chloroflexi bacterium]|jgi:glycine cleavage system H protein|nr:glycine cleavage system protein GcvH [Chloroflexota bacterium]